MGKPKGSPKTGGRKKGTPNKATLTVRQMVEAAIGKPLPELMIEFYNELPVWDKLSVLQGLMPYCYPKLTPKEDAPPPPTEEEIDKEIEEAKGLLQND